MLRRRAPLAQRGRHRRRRPRPAPFPHPLGGGRVAQHAPRLLAAPVRQRTRRPAAHAVAGYQTPFGLCANPAGTTRAWGTERATTC
ncbi:unnamed protein product [Callosobruchus maculatus]|uniref:Uncharacterized protein n=1 Tax=Callosobruchus maculatus TaxID=64391 RepID=A0A653BML4_CALMS|nr:unnamed protein product [Callosobruchus maculatus]